MSGVFGFDESVGRDTEQNVQGILSGMQSLIDKMKSDMNQTGASWEGDEKEQYLSIMTQFNSGAEQVKGGINQIRAMVSGTTDATEQMRGQVRKALGE